MKEFFFLNMVVSKACLREVVILTVFNCSECHTGKLFHISTFVLLTEFSVQCHDNLCKIIVKYMNVLYVLLQLALRLSKLSVLTLNISKQSKLRHIYKISSILLNRCNDNCFIVIIIIIITGW
jgi:hypothetical protein